MLAMTQLVGFGAGESDPFFSSVKLLLHFDGADAATTFIDSSLSARTITAVGNAQLDTAQFQFGGASYLGDGTGDHVSAAASADFDFGTGDFTVECWVRFNASTRKYLFCDGASNNAVLIITPSSGLVEVYGPASYVINTGSTAFNTGQWYHIALVRSGNSWALYRDGTSYVTATDSRSWGSSASAFIVGDDASGGTNSLNGWLDDFRVTKGVARYTAAFTPPTQPFPDG